MTRRHQTTTSDANRERVYEVYAAATRAGGPCIKVHEVAELTGMVEETVKVHTRSLAASGRISIEYRKGRASRRITIPGVGATDWSEEAVREPRDDATITERPGASAMFARAGFTDGPVKPALRLRAARYTHVPSQVEGAWR